MNSVSHEGQLVLFRNATGEGFVQRHDAAAGVPVYLVGAGTVAKISSIVDGQSIGRAVLPVGTYQEEVVREHPGCIIVAMRKGIPASHVSAFFDEAEGARDRAIVGFATDAPQPPEPREPIRCPHGSEMAALVAMLERAGIPYDWSPDGSGTEVAIGNSGESAPPRFYMGHGAGASFQFDSSGTLIRLELSGD